MSIYSSKNNRFKKLLKRKVFLSNELKKALFIAIKEAKKHKIYVSSELLLYSLLTEQSSIAAKLISITISQFRNNKSLTSNLISNRIQQINNLAIEERFNFDSLNANTFSSELWNENKLTPWLSTEVKDILKASIKLSLQSKDKLNVVTTKHVLFELLNKELVRELITKVID